MEQENTYPTQQNFEQQQPEAMELEGTPKYQQSTTDITPIKQSTPISTEQLEPNKPSTVKAWLTGKNIVNKLYGNPNYEKYSGVEITDKDENETGGLFFEKVQSFAESLANRVNFVKIKDIQSREVHSLVDVVAFVKEIRPSEYKQIIGGKIVVKAAEKVYLYDDTYSLISLTLPENTNISLAQNQVVVIKGARISDYSGTKTLAVSFATKIITDSNDMPSDPAIFKLLEWRNTEFNEDKLSLLNESADQKKKKMSTIEEIYYSLWDNSSTLNIALTAYISYIDVDRSDIVYPACENAEKCARKATPAGEDWYKCEHCGITFRDPIYRYNLQVKLSDPTGSMWVSIFDKVGNIIMGIDANMVNQLKKENQARVTRIFKDALNKEYKFTIQARNDYSGRLDKIKVRVTEVEEIEYSEFNNNLLGSLQAYKNK